MHSCKDIYEICPYLGKSVLITIHVDVDGGFGCAVDNTETEIVCQHQSDCIYAHRTMCRLVQNAGYTLPEQR